MGKPKKTKGVNIHTNKPKKSNYGVVKGATIYTYKKHKKPKRVGKSCVFFNAEKLTCKLNKMWCKDADNCSSYKPKEEYTAIKISSKFKRQEHSINEIGVTAIVLSDNRKCTMQNHYIQDINATIGVVDSTGKILNPKIPSAYCEECDLYFVLKTDFDKVKELGTILCPVINRTEKYLSKHKEECYAGSESEIHQLGYNVRRGNNYTEIQRHVILANIIENTNISKYEISSNINRCIAQHQNQPNYSDSVQSWKNDLEFVSNYKTGDILEVIIDKIIVGKR